MTPSKSLRACLKDFCKDLLKENLEANCPAFIPPDLILVLFLAALAPPSANSSSCSGTEKEI